MEAKTLANFFANSLNCKFTIYVPATTDGTKAIGNKIYVNATLSKLSSLFGGATACASVGAWVMESGELVTEETTQVFAFCTREQAEAFLQHVRDFCEWLKNEMKQECVALEFNGQMIFI